MSRHEILPFSIFLIAAVLLSSTNVAAGPSVVLARPESIPSVPTTPYLVDTWSSKAGLPQNSVNAITQTRDGYIWIATFGGLVRFDGQTFRTFTAANTPGLEADRLLSLREDSHGTLWIGSERAGVFMLRDGRFSRPAWADRLPGRQIFDIREAEDGTLWVATGAGAVRVGADGHVTPHTVEENGARRSITAVVEGSDGSIWLATNGSGAAQIVSDRVVVRSTTVDTEVDRVNAIHIERSGVVWLATQGGLFRLDGGDRQAVPLFRGPGTVAVRAIVPDNEGGIWIGTRRGLCHYRDQAAECYGSESGLADPFVRALSIDREGNLWVGTNAGGVARVRRRPATAYLPQASPQAGFSVLPIVGDGASGLWVGTLCVGLLHFHDGVFDRFGRAQGLPQECITTLHRDPDGTLWDGTTAGLMRITHHPEIRASMVGGVGDARIASAWRPGGAAPLRSARSSAVENVVRNAVRHAPPRTAVSVAMDATTPGRVEVTVRDRGPGVPPQALARLFDPFFRVDEARDRTSGGVGLGLAITRQAVLAHEGDVRAENHPDGGLLVRLALPVA